VPEHAGSLIEVDVDKRVGRITAGQRHA
jgi:hypothetical protein